MSRGWESKMVEGQQASYEAAEDPLVAEPAELPGAQDDASGTSGKAPEVPGKVPPPSERKGNVTADAETRRRRQALELQRERVLSERTSSPHRRSALETALLEIEEKLSELGWTVHL